MALLIVKYFLRKYIIGFKLTINFFHLIFLFVLSIISVEDEHFS